MENNAHNFSRFKAGIRRNNLMRKMDTLRTMSRWYQFTMLENVINMSSRNLSFFEKHSLGLGLTFNLHRKILSLWLHLLRNWFIMIEIIVLVIKKWLGVSSPLYCFPLVRVLFSSQKVFTMSFKAWKRITTNRSWPRFHERVRTPSW